MFNLREWIKEYWKLALSIIAIFLIGIGGTFFHYNTLNLNDKQKSEALEELDMPSEISSESKEDMKKEENYYVDIKGAVKKPGMYVVKADMRAMDAIEIAGGFLDEADQNQINLAMKLTDQMVLYIPKKGEDNPNLSITGNGVSTNNTNDSQNDNNQDKVNINTAEVTELQKLNGIGIKKAEAIIEYRNQNGSFKSIEDITKVSGIGQQTFNKLKEQLSI